MSEFQLELRDVCFFYDDYKVLEKVNAVFESGKIYVLLGKNGAGKSTLLNIMSGKNREFTGDITLNHMLFPRMYDSLKEDIGYLVEFPCMYPFLTVEEMIFLTGQLKGVCKEKIKQDMKKWSVIFQFEHVLHQNIDSLSQGTKKRVALTCTLIHNPKMILLDEPTNGLDPAQTMIFRDVIKGLVNENRIIILSTHLLDLAKKIADEIILLQQGKVYFYEEVEGDLEHIFM